MKPGKILRPTAGNNAPRPVTQRTEQNVPYRYIRPMGLGGDEGPRSAITTRYVDASGTELWHKNHGATVNDVAIDEDGNTYEVGDEYHEITLRKRTPSGRQLWRKKHGAPLNCCAICSDGVVVGGEPGTGGYTIRKYLADGTLAWSQTTAAEVIEITADSTNKVAALDGPANVWERVLYALAADGSLLDTVTHGGYGGEDNIVWPGGIAFLGTPESNMGLFADPFSLYINIFHFDIDVPGFVTQNAGFVWRSSAGYPDATYGTGLGQIFTHSTGVTPTTFAPAFGQVIRSTLRGLSTFVRVAGGAAYVITNQPPDYNDILAGGGLGLCSQPGFIWVAGTSLRRYSLASPPPAPSSGDREWNSLADWTVAHGGTIRGCQANSSNVSVLGGVEVPA